MIREDTSCSYSWLLSGLLLFALSAFARRTPFVVSLITLGRAGLQWLTAILNDPIGAFTPGIGLMIRIMFLVVVFGAVKSGYRARKLRQGALRQH